MDGSSFALQIKITSVAGYKNTSAHLFLIFSPIRGRMKKAMTREGPPGYDPTKSPDTQRPTETTAQPPGESGRLEQEPTPENPLWDRLASLNGFSPDERAKVDRYVREYLKDIGAISLSKKVLIGTSNDYSFFVPQSLEDRPDIADEQAVQLTFTRSSIIRDNSGRQAQIFLRALIAKDSPLLALTNKTHSDSALLDTILRVAAVYLDRAEKAENNVPLMAILDDRRDFSPGPAFGPDQLEIDAAQYRRKEDVRNFYSHDRDTRADRNDQTYLAEYESYLAQPVSSAIQTPRQEFYGDILALPRFQAYRDTLLASVEPIKRAAQERAAAKREQKLAEKKESERMRDELGRAFQSLVQWSREHAAKLTTTLQASDSPSNDPEAWDERLEVKGTTADAQTTITVWARISKSDGTKEDYVKYRFVVLPDTSTSSARDIGWIEIYSQDFPAEPKQAPATKLVFKPMHRGALPLMSTGWSRDNSRVLDRPLEAIEEDGIELGRAVQYPEATILSHQTFQEMLKDATVALGEVQGFLNTKTPK